MEKIMISHSPKHSSQVTRLPGRDVLAKTPEGPHAPNGKIRHSFARSLEILAELIPGTRSYIELDGMQLKFECTVVGFKKSQFIILTIPSHASMQQQNVFPLLYNGNRATFYIMLGGKLTALKSHVIRFTMDPFPLLFVSLPQDCTVVNLRRSLRVRCLFRAVVLIDGYELNGMVTDVSIGGCGFVCSQNNTAQLIENGLAVTLDCSQLSPGEPCLIPACVRSNSVRSNSIRVGLEFGQCSEQTLKPLQAFIAEASTLGENC